jgi:Circularly permutated YpsA SLOG family
MLEKIISGGETGASQAAWRAAKAVGVSTGGWVRRGFLAEDGPHPEFAEQYAGAELPLDNDEAVTEQNVKDSDATLWFGQTTTAGAHATVAACLALGRPYMPVYPGASFEPSHVADWIRENTVKILYVAGNREHDEPGIGDRVERFFGQVLEQLGHGPSQSGETSFESP